MPKPDKEMLDEAIELLKGDIARLGENPADWEALHSIYTTAVMLQKFQMSHNSINELCDVELKREESGNAARTSKLCEKMQPLAEQLLEYLRTLAV